MPHPTEITARLVLSWLVLSLAPYAVDAGYLGIVPTAVRLDAGDQSPRFGIRIVAVLPSSPAERAGLELGDVIVAIDEQTLEGSEEADTVAIFRARLAEARSGSTLDLTILRSPSSESAVRSAVFSDRESKKLVVVLGESLSDRFTRLPSSEKLVGEQTLTPHSIAKELEGWLKQHDLEREAADLYRRLASLADRGDVARPQVLTLIERQPLQLPSILDPLIDGFRRAGSDTADAAVDLGQALSAVSAMTTTLFEPPAFRSLDPPAPGASTETHLDWLERLLASAAGHRSAAFQALDAQELERLEVDWRTIGDRFESHLDLDTDPNRERLAANLATVRAGEKVDLEQLLECARILSAIAKPSYLEALRADLERADLELDQERVLERATAYGSIVISGQADSRHVDNQAAVLIDLGGNDFYGSGAGTTVGEWPESREVRGLQSISVVVDLEGNDAYESTQEGAQGCGVLGVGLLVDLTGDDSYLGGRWAQGCGFLGIGVLVDLAGDDTYRAHSFSQAIGFFGVGLLIDAEGRDRYQSTNLSQAVGLPGGAGILVDRAGDDEYFSKGSRPTSYGQRGLFDSYSQGCGVGFRNVASGGIAFLVDESGSDRYEAGAFSQGGGYYYGVGALVDGGSADDHYIGSRYSQGFAAHQSAGYFVEEGGDDRYETRYAVMAGLAWDQSIAFFIEHGGNDHYQGGYFSLGASAHNSIAVFLEHDGLDDYPASPIAPTGPNDYHGGSSLSVFVDEGSDADRYRSRDRVNSMVRVGGSASLVVDR